MIPMLSGSRSGDGEQIVSYSVFFFLIWFNHFLQPSGSYVGSSKDSTAASVWWTRSALRRSPSVTAAPGSWLPAPAASWTWTGSVAPPRPSGSWQPSQSSSSSPAAFTAAAAGILSTEVPTDLMCPFPFHGGGDPRTRRSCCPLEEEISTTFRKRMCLETQMSSNTFRGLLSIPINQAS